MAPFVSIFLLSLNIILVVAANDTRIISGVTSELGQFPFAAAIYHEKSGALHFCSGSLINDHWVLTAAHCLEGATALSVILGTNFLNQASTTGLVINSTAYVIYPTYNTSVLKDDIGLIYLNETVTFSNRIQPVELPTEHLEAYEQAIALGWGAISDGNYAPSNSLQHVSLTAIANAVCRRMYGNFIHDTVVCLSGESNEGVCRGDSGGPLVQITSDGRHVQVGVASFFSGAGCEAEHPSGFTRTFSYVDWIKNVTARGSSPLNTLFLPLMLFTLFIVITQ